ncbi:ankyrin repeat-containing domain protein [Xylariomycetidae sp. FL0641]|nr:ankyrin repeat-containing domain protein [Xylariomycetidae sp. FL0641]
MNNATLNRKDSTQDEQKLSDDILWHVARDCLTDARDVFALAITSRSLWASLEPIIYKADVLRAKHYAEENEGLLHPFYLRCHELYQEYHGPCTPLDGGRFPDESDIIDAIDHRRDCPLEDPEDEENPRRRKKEPPKSPTDRLPLPRDQTILQWAALTGVDNTAQKAISVAKEVWPDYLDFENPVTLQAAVHTAAIYGHTSILRLLKQNGACVNAVAGYYCLPLRPLDAVLKHINPRTRDMPPDMELSCLTRPFALNALGFALLREHDEAARFLADFYDDAEIHYLEQPDEDEEDGDDDEEHGRGPYIGTYDEQGVFAVPPLHLAAFVGMVDVAKVLIGKGADANLRCLQVQESTPLMWAATRKDNNEMIDILLSHGAQIDLRDMHDRGALEWALKCWAPKTACRLVREGADYSHRNERLRGSCALSWSMASDIFLDCTKLIMEEKPHLRETSQSFLSSCVQTALELEYCGKNSRTIDYIIENDIGLGRICEKQEVDDMQNSVTTGRSILQYATRSHRVSLEQFRRMLEKCSDDVNLPNYRLETPAAIAIYRSYDFDKLALLLKHGADPEACRGRPREMLRAYQNGASVEEVKNLEKELNEQDYQRYLEKAKKEAREDLRRKFAELADTPEQIDEMEAQDLIPNNVRRIKELAGLSMEEILKLKDQGLNVNEECWRYEAEAWRAAHPGEEETWINNDEEETEQPKLMGKWQR